MRWVARYWRHVPTPLRQMAVLVAALIVLAPGLPFYTAFAQPVSLPSAPGVAWSGPIGAFVAGRNTPGAFTGSFSNRNTSALSALACSAARRSFLPLTSSHE